MRVRDKQFFLTLNFLVSITLFCTSHNNAEGRIMADTKQYRIKMSVGDTLLAAILDANQTTRDFISLLPLD